MARRIEAEGGMRGNLQGSSPQSEASAASERWSDMARRIEAEGGMRGEPARFQPAKRSERSEPAMVPALHLRPGYAGPSESVIQTLGTWRGGVMRKGACGGNLQGSSPQSEASAASERWCRGPDLNWGHRDFQSRALPS